MDNGHIEVNIATARKWYNKGGEWAELALQAYSESELLNDKPMSWEAYVSKYTGEHSNYGLADGEIVGSDFTGAYFEFPDKKDAKAFVALGMLIKLRDAWRGSWKPDWESLEETKYVIENWNNSVHINTYLITSRILAFPTLHTRDRFLNTFEDLIKEAKELI